MARPQRRAVEKIESLISPNFPKFVAKGKWNESGRVQNPMVANGLPELKWRA
jgi:hypothetical protein